MGLKKFIDRFSINKYSEGKRLLNAIITTNKSYRTKNENHQRTFNRVAYLYAFWIFVVTISSVAVLAVGDKTLEENAGIFTALESITLITLLADYVFRCYTAEVRLKKGNWSYLMYPFTFSGILLFLSLLPSLYLIGIWGHFSFMEQFQNLKFLRIFRIVLLGNLMPGVAMFTRVLKKESKILYTLFGFVILVILLFAIVIFNTEKGIDATGKEIGDKGFDPTTVDFNNFWDAIYYATIALTTIGFGDKTPHTDFGKGITIAMSLTGIAILATPSGIIAGGFISEIKIQREINEQKTLEVSLKKLKENKKLYRRKRRPTRTKKVVKTKNSREDKTKKKK